MQGSMSVDMPTSTCMRALGGTQPVPVPSMLLFIFIAPTTHIQLLMLGSRIRKKTGK